MSMPFISRFEASLKRHFDVSTTPMPLEVIDSELKQVTDRILEMTGGLTA